ncbi:MAG: hypothetical protein ACRCTL_11035 [Pseudomonas sp.]
MVTPNQMLLAGTLAFAFYGGWSWRADIADADMAQFKEGIAQQAADQRELKAKVEAGQAGITQQSSARLDQQAAQQQEAIQYVDREVVVFRDRWRSSACTLPADWLRLYNQSLGLAGAVPDTTEAGSAPADGAVRVPGS